ncbi:helix-turn-helix domain-containing protein [Pseudothauera lacus]|uniref:Cyclic nucleotide-binding protein n=1 Tax=Pseudothauera lacus TaxID=2136175 RepID=A0A2T4IFC8_9RHOO|nr:helix-turn-helix domain-containing protein [Pseudothauera lacus]PTD96471.1 cyclic nucleotide-binding protein [Pseudothauera lacus]
MLTPPPGNDPRQNRILARLPDADYFRLEGDLECVPLALGQVLFAPGDTLEHVYFPTSGIVSMVFTTEDGSSAELAMTGKDGLVGTPLILGGETTTYMAVVQSKGSAYRLRAEIVAWELEQGGSLQQLALGYVQALMIQMAQGVVCNRHHTVDQQLCRWLLLSLDQLPGNQLDMTQELIANMLGVRREGVTEAAGKLQAAGLIRYRRGQITILDQRGLEARACECYRVVRTEYDRLFGLNPAVPVKGRVRPNPATLRRRAEQRLLNQVRPPRADAVWDAARLVHELEVHQIELEMHNEELRRAYAEADALRARYADIYDFAPVPYLTVDARGTVLELNLTAAIMLGIKRSQKGLHRLGTSLAEISLPLFVHFLDEVLRGMKKGYCEVVLKPTPRHPETLVRLEGVPDEEGVECRVVMTTIRSDLPGQADRRRQN